MINNRQMKANQIKNINVMIAQAQVHIIMISILNRKNHFDLKRINLLKYLSVHYKDLVINKSNTIKFLMSIKTMPI
jgi:hypothetical protein